MRTGGAVVLTIDELVEEIPTGGVTGNGVLVDLHEFRGWQHRGLDLVDQFLE